MSADMNFIRNHHLLLSQTSSPYFKEQPLIPSIAEYTSPFSKDYRSSEFSTLSPLPSPSQPPPKPSSSTRSSISFSPHLSTSSARGCATSTSSTATTYSRSKTVDKKSEGEPKQSRFLPVISKEKRAEMNIVIFNQIAEITQYLYLCAAAAVSREKVRSLQITHIINCTLDVPNFKGENVECVNIQVDDSSRAHLGIYFDRCADMIRQASLKNGKVLVHCVAGVSRSASLCIAYLMKYERMSLLQAYKFVKRKRYVIHPNVGFWQQLIEYEKRIFGRATVKMVYSNVGMVPEVYIEEENELLRLQQNSRHR
ncbi:dual specificity protein phosphatase 14-like [Octopus vulgaris]|uniref:Dual specificity protein phosphatase 14-like n=1 Tax=Octopus vulgaris TaxID=6645 RepID=A0AA36BKJ1_OCTVU|nr:dual specificity protein phosphatase 14-like [Octopus vulgaris]